MRVKQNVTIYYCDHCKKKMFRKHAMEHHEKWCPSNPDNCKACSNCIHLEETTVEIYRNGEGEYSPAISKAFKCKVLDKLLYPLKVEMRGLQNKYETFDDQEPMPKVCEHQNLTPQWEF